MRIRIDNTACYLHKPYSHLNVVHCNVVDPDLGTGSSFTMSEMSNRDLHQSQNKRSGEDDTATNKTKVTTSKLRFLVFCKFGFKATKKCYDNLKHCHRKI
jgi:hypothetical protein